MAVDFTFQITFILFQDLTVGPSGALKARVSQTLDKPGRGRTDWAASVCGLAQDEGTSHQY